MATVFFGVTSLAQRNAANRHALKRRMCRCSFQTVNELISPPGVGPRPRSRVQFRRRIWASSHATVLSVELDSAVRFCERRPSTDS